MTFGSSITRSRATVQTPTAIGALIVFAVVASIVFGGYIVGRQIVSGLLLGSIYMTVAVAFTLTIGVLNFLNFTIPSLFMLTGMVAWGLMSNGYVKFAGGWAWLAALGAGVAVAVVASLLVEQFTFRYLKMKHGDATEHAIPLVSSLGFLLIFEHLVLISLGSESQRFAIPFKADIHVAGLVIGAPQIASCVLAIAVVAALSFILKNTKTGRALRTIAESPDTASLLGVEVDKVVPVVFVLTGLLGRCCRRPLHGQLRQCVAVHGRQRRHQGDRRHGAWRNRFDLGSDRRRPDHRTDRDTVDLPIRRRLGPDGCLGTVARHHHHSTAWIVRHRLGRPRENVMRSPYAAQFSRTRR